MIQNYELVHRNDIPSESFLESKKQDIDIRGETAGQHYIPLHSVIEKKRLRYCCSKGICAR